MDRDQDNGKESAVIDTEGRGGAPEVVLLRGRLKLREGGAPEPFVPQRGWTNQPNQNQQTNPNWPNHTNSKQTN